MKNTLSLIEAIVDKCRADGTTERYEAYIEALARKVGLTDAEIHDRLSEDYLTVIYRP